MKRGLVFLTILTVSISLAAQNLRADYLAYIEKYAPWAVENEQKYQIPACITLAQGLLESAAGKSDLATKANNHFGIKCGSDWSGATYTHDDETKNECFRKYKKAEESFLDHSKFLHRSRYSRLFDLPLTDYKGWAHGLKQCGYATDPAYPNKLIKLIEDYNLTQYGTGANSKPVEAVEPETTVEEEEETLIAPQKDEVLGYISFEEHPVKRENGCRYVVARAGDSFQSIGFEFNITEKALRRYNDVSNPKYELNPGDRVYLRLKKRSAASKYATYRVKRGENIWQIAQDKAIRLKRIYQLNGIEEGRDVTVNQELRLR